MIDLVPGFCVRVWVGVCSSPQIRPAVLSNNRREPVGAYDMSACAQAHPSHPNPTAPVSTNLRSCPVVLLLGVNAFTLACGVAERLLPGGGVMAEVLNTGSTGSSWDSCGVTWGVCGAGLSGL